MTTALAILAAASLALELHLVDVAAHAQQLESILHGRLVGAAFIAGLPYPVVDPQFGPPRSVHLAIVALGAVQAAIVFALYRALRDRAVPRLERAALGAVAAVMLAIALAAPAMAGFDAYAYAGYAKLPHFADAYAPPALRLGGSFGVVNDVWGTPLVPSYYGPLWIAISKVVAGGAQSLGSAIFAFRLVEVGALAWIAIVLGAWRRDALFVALFALNPAVYGLYVANAHNDLFAVALILTAVALSRRFPIVAAITVAAAASIKVPFVAAALYVFAGRGSQRTRLGWVVVAVILAAGISVVFGGHAYAADLISRLHETNAGGRFFQLTARAIKIGLLLVAGTALAAAFARGIAWRTAGWSFITLGSLAYPWYLIWALPYAALERGALVAFLVLLPFVAAVMEPAFTHLGLGQVAMLAMLLAAAFEMFRRQPVNVAQGWERSQ
ncbi:MAG: hypothetical protein M3169_01300 [Candidatus Eremiobacteraeota bacterium]|nr:hypothetical protein [Candidatus Eremiobacteraeota bacterium]